MSAISSYTISKLFLALPFSKILMDLDNKHTIQIKVDSPALSASYYKEYLGFRVIKGTFLRRYEIIVKNGINHIIFSSMNESLNHETITIESINLNFNSSEIEEEYYKIKEKVRIVAPMTLLESGKKIFEIKDCNGIKIVYTDTLS